MTDATTTAATYFEAWKARDFTRLRSVLADDVDFPGRSPRCRAATTASRACRAWRTS